MASFSIDISTIALPKKYKIVLLGDQGTGKTSILKRYMQETFDPSDAKVRKKEPEF